MLAYQTLMKKGVGEYEEKRSRFVAHAAPVYSEDDAIAYLKEIRHEGSDAGHHCYAYAIDGETVIRRFSDDDEPTGTAGVPILEVINKQQLTNCIIIVSRWFGGVLLGTSGLIRSYGKAASKSVEDAKVINVRGCILTTVRIPYTLSGKIDHYIIQEKILVSGTNYDTDVTIQVAIEPNQQEVFLREITNLTSALAVVTFGETQPIAFTKDGVFIRHERHIAV